MRSFDQGFPQPTQSLPITSNPLAPVVSQQMVLVQEVPWSLAHPAPLVVVPSSPGDVAI
jgi:hypothetical protein